MGRFAHAATRLYVRTHEHSDFVWAGKLEIYFGVRYDSLSNVSPSSTSDESTKLRPKRNLLLVGLAASHRLF